MANFGTIFVAAVVAFVATNLDDLVLLIVFFAQTQAQQRKQEALEKGDSSPPTPSNSRASAAASSSADPDVHAAQPPPARRGSASGRRAPSSWEVVFGHLMGFTVLIGLSLLGLLLGLFLKSEWLGWLGLLPFTIGLIMLILQIKRGCCKKKTTKAKDGVDDGGSKDTDRLIDPAPQPAPGENKDSKQPIVDIEAAKSKAETKSSSTQAPTPAVKTEDGDDDDDDDDDDDSCLATGFQKCCGSCTCCISPFMVTVAAAVIASGGDNIAVWLPLFAAASTGAVIETVVIFYVMQLLWCLASWSFVRCEFVAKALSKCGKWVSPILLMAIGVWVIYSAGSFSML